MQKWNEPPACSNHGLHRFLSSYWLAHLLFDEKTAKLLLISVWSAECLNSLLMSRNPKKNRCLSRIFGAWFGGKYRGLSTCKPWSKQAGGWIHFCIKRLRTLNSYQIFKIKTQKSKTYSGWCPFHGLFIGITVMQIQSGRMILLTKKALKSQPALLL